MKPYASPWIVIVLVFLSGCVAPSEAPGNQTEDKTTTPSPTPVASGSASPTPAPSDSPSPSPTVTPTATPSQTPDAGQTHTVEIGKNIKGVAADYSPTTVTIRVGDSVIWKNLDSYAHTATDDDEAWDTGSIGGGKSSTAILFDSAGTYTYYCNFHEGTMNGARVIVEE